MSTADSDSDDAYVQLSPEEVRSAGDLDEEEYPDSALEFAITLAEAIVNDDLAPSASNMDRVALAGALLAAAYASEDQMVESVQQESASVTFDTEQGLSLWRKATQADPTNRLRSLEKPAARISVTDVRQTRKRK